MWNTDTSDWIKYDDETIHLLLIIWFILNTQPHSRNHIEYKNHNKALWIQKKS